MRRSHSAQAIDEALGDRRGIARYGDAVVPMDDALARAAVDLGGRPHTELRLEHDPGLAGHMLASLAQAARAAIHVEATGRDAHHVAEAAFKAVGRALRVAVRREGDGLPSTKGLPVKVAICEYGAGNVRSVELAFRRLGAELVDDVAGADLAVLPGVGSARAAMAGLRERGHDDALPTRVAAGRPVLGICLGLAAGARVDATRTAASKGSGCVPGRAVRLREGRVPRMGWAEVEPLGDAFYFAHSYAAETAMRDRVVGGHRRRGRAPGRSSAASFTRRRAARPARAIWLEEVSCLSRV